MKPYKVPRIGRNKKTPKHVFYTVHHFALTGGPVIFKVCVFIIDKSREVLLLTPQVGVMVGSNENCEDTVRRLLRNFFSKKVIAEIAIHQCPVPIN